MTPAAVLPSAIEDALVPLSALQHHLFCPRQCALIHLEQLWAEDAATADGRLLHEKVDAGGSESRPGIRVARGLMLRSLALGVSGRADAVEFHGRPPIPFPVEYKRGKPKAHQADEVQLCAQAICLEEMFAVAVPQGALFYGMPRRRTLVAFDADLRALTAAVAAATAQTLAGVVTPLPRHKPAWLRKDGANLVVEVEGAERGRAPLHMLEGVVTFGRPGASPALMLACAENGIALSFLDPNGRFLARVEGPRSGNVLLRRAQFKAVDDATRATPIVRAIVTAKTANQRTVLRRVLRDYAETLPPDGAAALATAESRLTDIARRTLRTEGVDALRGLEGEAAATYFGVFSHLVRVEDPAFRFAGRTRRPPLDRVNALLSFLYAMLGHDCRSALEAHGLDPQFGFLHADRPGRASLALDLMEELRPVLADRLAISLINRRQLAADDFIVEESGGVRLTDPARAKVLVAWQERKRDELRHPFLNEAMPFGLVAHAQAQMLARHLRGDLDGYPAFIWK